MLGLMMIALSVTVAALVVGAVWRVMRPAGSLVTAAVAGWMTATGAAAAAGVLSFASRPPTMLIMLAGAAILTTWLAFSRVGDALIAAVPIGWIIGFQAFRVPVELWLSRGYAEGAFPVQMTFHGLNFDIVSGLTAVAVGLLVWKGVAGRRVILSWNVLGSLLLLNIVTIAILSAPLPIRVFAAEPANVYVTDFPGVWLPAILVQAALLGHLLVFRWVRRVRAPERVS